MRMAHPAETSGAPPVPVATPTPSTASLLSQSASPRGLFSAGVLMDEILTAEANTSDLLYGKDIETPYPGIDIQWPTPGRETGAGLFSHDDGEPEGILRGDDLDDAPSVVEHFAGLPVTPWPKQGLPAIVAERLRATAIYLDRIPRALVETMGTPWCHSQVFKGDVPKDLKGMPSRNCLATEETLLTSFPSDAIACSALYGAKSPENETFVMKTLISNLSDLSKSPLPSTHKEALARTHALVMYHIMALFDGDIESRAVAESALPHLELACESLLSHISYDDLWPENTTKDLPLFPLANTEAFWRAWILQESTRRTWLFANQLILMYSFLTNRKTQAGLSAQCRTLCLSGSLWRAQNAVDFAAAWGSGRRLVARLDRLDEVFSEARAVDLDEFGRMLLTCYMGEQEARGWMSVKGGGG